MAEQKLKKFLSIDEVYDEFEKMIQEVGKSAHISPALTRKYTKEGLKEWEKSSKLDVLKLYKKPPEKQKEEIPKMIQSIRPKLEVALDKEEAINEVLDDIADTFKEIYDLK